MINALIIDDEPDAVASLTLLLEEYCKIVKLVGTANAFIPGIREINAKKPDLVFMDVEMQNTTGFDILECIQDVNFSTIFITGHHDYAIKAIKVNAFDYLLKPVDPDELSAAINRLVAAKTAEHSLAHNHAEPENQKMQVSTSEGRYYLSYRDIIHLKSEGSYTTIFCKGEKSVLVSKNLKSFEGMLEGHGFFRVHNSHIINIDCIEKIVRTDGGYVVLSDNSIVELSRGRKEEFFQRIGVVA